MEGHVEDLERRMGGIAKNLGQNPICDHVNTETKSSFSSQITRFSISHKFKQPHLDSYNGSESLIDHVRTYKAQMALSTNADKLLCLAFPSTLKRSASQWFHSLKPRSISYFKQLRK